MSDRAIVDSKSSYWRRRSTAAQLVKRPSQRCLVAESPFWLPQRNDEAEQRAKDERPNHDAGRWSRLIATHELDVGVQEVQIGAGLRSTIAATSARSVRVNGVRAADESHAIASVTDAP